MQSRAIPDNRISASSSQQPAIAARLQSVLSWCAYSSDSNPYLQIDLGSDHVVCAVATQGNNAVDQWVTSYRISTSSDGMLWTTYTENNITKTFYGNYDRSTMARHVLYHCPITRNIRIEPITYQGIPCLRTEIYGYQLQPRNSDKTTVVTNAIRNPFIAKFVRVLPTAYKGWIALRVDFKGTSQGIL
ncbi:hypothetical protein QZH41_017222 [Actinostola sp. cb2023]|nr:hypothetical protein QZH41_017222 [Actinostola sp. cb2023]